MVATRRQQREAAASRQAANAGPRNQTTSAAARSGPRNQTAASAARLGPRNQTAAAATGRLHARNRRARGDIGNHVTAAAAAAVDGEANRRRIHRCREANHRRIHCYREATRRRLHRYMEANGRRLTRSLSAQLSRSASVQPNAAVADENTIAPARRAAVDGASASRAVSVEERFEELDRNVQWLYTTVATVQKAMKKLESEKAQKEAQLQKLMEENVRLLAMLDKKEAQLQAMSEQCKFMALDRN